MTSMGGARFTGRFPLSRGTRPPPFPRDTFSPALRGFFFACPACGLSKVEVLYTPGTRKY